MIISSPQKRLCPFLLDPFENCYCAKMDSQDIERAVNLCNYNFETCEIYQKNNGNGTRDKKRGKDARGDDSDKVSLNMPRY